MMHLWFPNTGIVSYSSRCWLKYFWYFLQNLTLITSFNAHIHWRILKILTRPLIKISTKSKLVSYWHVTVYGRRNGLVVNSPEGRKSKFLWTPCMRWNDGAAADCVSHPSHDRLEPDPRRSLAPYRHAPRTAPEVAFSSLLLSCPAQDRLKSGS